MTDWQKSLANARQNAEHSTRLRYQCGCRCVCCRAANSNYVKQRRNACLAGLGNGLVSPAKARGHLARLSKANVGLRSVADVTGIAYHTICDIRTGKKTHIRQHTEQKILSVTSGAVAGGALVSAKRTWRRINLLLREGFTKAEIARRLGYKRGQLNIAKKWVTAKTAAKIERLYTLTMQI